MKETKIFYQNKPFVDIVISTGATEQERYAAAELRHYLNLMTCSLFEIVQTSEKPGITIGAAAAELGIKPPKPLGDEGFYIKSHDQGIAVLGGKRGVIYGVYELLEKFGCRFFSVTCEKVPVYDELSLPETDDCQIPVLEYREHSYYELKQNPNLVVKLRLNGSFNRVDKKWGGHNAYPLGWFVHSMKTFITPEEYAETNPDYFAIVNGKRIFAPELHEPCLTHPDVFSIALKNVRETLHNNPDARIISISQNDNFTNCECESCKASDEEEGSAAGTMLKFVNAIAEALEKEFPDIIFDTLAYQQTRKPPRITKPRHNVCVRLCSIECCFTHPLGSCDTEPHRSKTSSAASFIDDLRAWKQISERTYIWDYTTCFSHYPLPFPNWNVLQPNIQTFVENGVKGIYEQANTSTHGGCDLNELRAYLISKILWDPYTDADRHIKEFTDCYYGDAAPYIRKYIKALTDKVEKDNIHTGIFTATNTSYLTPDMLEIYKDIINQAKTAVQGDPLRLRRVGLIELSLRYVEMMNNNKSDNKYDKKQMRDLFLDFKGYGLSRMSEWYSPQITLNGLLYERLHGADPKDHVVNEGRETY